MKNVYFSTKQYNVLKEALAEKEMLSKMSEKPFKYIEEYQDGFLDNSDMYKGILHNGYIASVKDFSDDITRMSSEDVLNKYNKLLAKCSKLEGTDKSSLEKLCYNTVVEIFDIPEDEIQLDLKIVDEIDPEQNFHTKPDDDYEFSYEDANEIGKIKAEVAKRKFLNAMICGASVDISKNASQLYVNELFQINEELPHLYSKLMKIGRYLMYCTKITNNDDRHNQGAFVTVKLGNEMKKSLIEVKALNFPMLLSETIKGLLELCISNGLPDNMDTAKFVLNKSDVLVDEPFNMIVGYPLWRKFVDAKDIDTKVIPSYVKNMSMIDAEELLKYVNEVVLNTKLGNRFKEAMLEETEDEYGYGEFEDDILKKSDEDNIISDGYLDENDLNEDYPEAFNMEEFKQLRSFAARVRYCEQKLRRISSGSARIVYEIDNEKVLKLAKNTKGLAQNEAEGNDWYLQKIGCFAKIYDVDENYLWIEMQKARRATAADFRRLTGHPFEFLCGFVNYVHSLYSRRWQTHVDKKLYEEFMNSEEYEYSLFSELYEYLANYGLESIGDIKKASSWGVVSENNTEYLVLVDFGITDYVADTYYSKR